MSISLGQGQVRPRANWSRRAKSRPRTHEGRLLRIRALIDESTRECLALRIAWRLNSQDVIETLPEVMLWRGIPEHIRSGNGPEFVARQLRNWPRD